MSMILVPNLANFFQSEEQDCQIRVARSLIEKINLI